MWIQSLSPPKPQFQHALDNFFQVLAHFPLTLKINTPTGSLHAAVEVIMTRLAAESPLQLHPKLCVLLWSWL